MMNIKKTAKRIGAGAMNMLKGTLENMGSEATKKRYAEMDASAAKKRADMIRENFGNEERYREVSNPDDPLFTPTYKKVGAGIGKAVKGLGSFTERLMNARKTAVEAGKGAGKAIKKVIK
jgi:hypothetical protein